MISRSMVSGLIQDVAVASAIDAALTAKESRFSSNSIVQNARMTIGTCWFRKADAGVKSSHSHRNWEATHRFRNSDTTAPSSFLRP